MSKPRYTKKHRPKESRTIPLPSGNKIQGNGLDYKKLYRCWHCGWVCRTDRDSLGGSRSSSGTAHDDYNVPSAAEDSNLLVLGGKQDSFCVVLENGADGSPKEIRHSFESVISSGCPLCGCRNWKGEY